jgi:hypothetical protein
LPLPFTLPLVGGAAISATPRQQRKEIVRENVRFISRYERKHGRERKVAGKMQS